jgi:hypothetical protein
MNRLVIENSNKADLIFKIAVIAKKVVNALMSIKPGDLLSEDIKYRFYFYQSFIPNLYQKHITDCSSNCLFCCHLTKSRYHRSCLICTKGTYDKCYFPFPDVLLEDSTSTNNEGILPKPWYFMKTCDSFERLEKNMYYRNLHFPFSSITIRNYETLEGLENGFLSNIRPCYICASVDYDLYKRCKRQGDCDICIPCLKIEEMLSDAYDRQPSSIRTAG